MLHSISEVFYSIQGEGYWVGRPAVFIRYAGCDLRCEWCDTPRSREVLDNRTKDFTTEGLLAEVLALNSPSNFFVITGGEPLLQQHAVGEFVRELRKNLPQSFVALETNGTHLAQDTKALLGVDWITVSPKPKFDYISNLHRDGIPLPVDELKCVHIGGAEGNALLLQSVLCFDAQNWFVQPCYRSGGMSNVKECIAFAKKHPSWRLSVQLHKMLNLR